MNKRWEAADVINLGVLLVFMFMIGFALRGKAPVRTRSPDPHISPRVRAAKKYLVKTYVGVIKLPPYPRERGKLGVATLELTNSVTDSIIWYWPTAWWVREGSGLSGTIRATNSPGTGPHEYDGEAGWDLTANSVTPEPTSWELTYPDGTSGEFTIIWVNAHQYYGDAPEYGTVGSPPNYTYWETITFPLPDPPVCSYAVDPDDFVAVGVAGGEFEIGVVPNLEECEWAASTATAWLTKLDSDDIGTGSATFEAERNLGPARNGLVTAAGVGVVVNQAGPGSGGDCIGGYHYNPVAGTCDPVETECPEGYHLDEDLNACVPDPDPTPGGGIVPVPFDEIRFPEKIDYGSSGGTSFKTTVIGTDSGFEQRIAHWVHGRGIWTVPSGIKNRIQKDVIKAFFVARQGMLRGFRFKDWDDYKAIDQSIITLTSTTFQLAKHYVSGSQNIARVIKKPVAGTLVITAVDEEDSIPDWEVDTVTGVVTFETAPPAFTATFEFDVPVRFNTDVYRNQRDGFEVNEWPSIDLIEIKV